jgi:hypothetical protein
MLIKAAAYTVGHLCIWFVATRAAPDFAPRPCVWFDKPVWHYVKSGRPERFMYERDSIKA